MRWLLMMMVTCGLTVQGGEPTAETVVANYLKAIGGADKVRAIKTLKKEGIYVYNGLEHAMTVWHKTNKVLFEIDGLSMYGSKVTSGEVVLRGYDGTRAWDLDPGRGPKPAPIAEPKTGALINEAFLISPMTAKDSKIELKGRENLEGVDVWRLQVTTGNGSVQDWFLNAKTWLPVKKSVAEKDMFLPQAVFFDDYRPVNGVLMPHYVELEEGLFARVHLFEKITVNPDVDDQKFSMPK